MKKLSLADKLAKKTFESPNFRKSWDVHMQAFGPILEPAFQENYQAKVHLTAALNMLSSGNLAQGLQKLQKMEHYCETDTDKTAFLFFMGVFCELSGNREQMAEFYCAANDYGHSLAMPYIKAGKFFLENHSYEPAYEQYQGAIGCYTATGLSDQDKIVLGTVYCNLATCLTMMHRYEEAEQAAAASRSLCPDAPGRAAVEATLYALRGDTQQLETCLDTLKAHSPDAYEPVKKCTDGILAETDPLFFAVPVEEEKIRSFWAWFGSYSPELLSLLDQQQYEAAMTPVGKHLLEAFPFLEETPCIGLGRNEKGYVLELHDCYAVGIADAYEKLLDACPDTIRSQWQFFTVH